MEKEETRKEYLERSIRMLDAPSWQLEPDEKATLKRYRDELDTLSTNKE